jgi:hypothetical protein
MIRGVPPPRSLMLIAEIFLSFGQLEIQEKPPEFHKKDC